MILGAVFFFVGLEALVILAAGKTPAWAMGPTWAAAMFYMPLGAVMFITAAT